jgi:hypothetical protein
MNVHEKLAKDVWRLIKALDPGVPDESGDLDDIAVMLIVMACDCAVEAAKLPSAHVHSSPHASSLDAYTARESTQIQTGPRAIPPSDAHSK